MMFDLIEMLSSQRSSQQACKQGVSALSRLLLEQSIALALVLPPLVALPALASEPSVSDEAVVTAQMTRRPARRRIQRPAPPRRLPPNLVQPGGGLDIAAQACSPESAPLTALVPVENPVLTVRDYPTFLFHLPDAPEAVNYVEFILLSADEKDEIHSVRFAPMASGIVSVSLPVEAKKMLEPGQVYHWYLNLHCQTAAGIPSVNGWVRRETVDELSELLPSSALPEIWYDAIAQAALTLEQTPLEGEAALAQWNSLLTAAGLDELTGIPVLGPILRSEVAAPF